MSDDSHTEQDASDSRSAEKKPVNKQVDTLTLAYMEEQVDALNNEVVGDWLKRHAVYAELASYKPPDFDGLTNWPIVQQGCYIVLASQVSDMVATGQEATTPPVESAQLPKDNQIDVHTELVEIILGKNGDAYSKSELILAALATAIREATPGQQWGSDMKPSGPDSNIKVNAKSPGGGQKGRI